MRLILFVHFLISSLTSWSQVTFTSPITQHFPSGELEIIERILRFDGKEFVIESKTVVNTWHTQKWIVKEYFKMEFPIHGPSHLYVCDSPDGFYTTYILIPDVDPIEYIEVIQPKQLHFERNHYRSLVD